MVWLSSWTVHAESNAEIRFSPLCHDADNAVSAVRGVPWASSEERVIGLSRRPQRRNTASRSTSPFRDEPTKRIRRDDCGEMSVSD